MSFIDSVRDRLTHNEHYIFDPESTDWLEMSAEKVLDSAIYLCADYVRLKGHTGDVTDAIIKLLEDCESWPMDDAYMMCIHGVIKLYKDIDCERAKREK